MGVILTTGNNTNSNKDENSGNKERENKRNNHHHHHQQHHHHKKHNKKGNIISLSDNNVLIESNNNNSTTKDNVQYKQSFSYDKLYSNNNNNPSALLGITTTPTTPTTTIGNKFLTPSNNPKKPSSLFSYRNNNSPSTIVTNNNTTMNNAITTTTTTTTSSNVASPMITTGTTSLNTPPPQTNNNNNNATTINNSTTTTMTTTLMHNSELLRPPSQHSQQHSPSSEKYNMSNTNNMNKIMGSPNSSEKTQRLRPHYLNNNNNNNTSDRYNTIPTSGMHNNNNEALSIGSSSPKSNFFTPIKTNYNTNTNDTYSQYSVSPDEVSISSFTSRMSTKPMTIPKTKNYNNRGYLNDNHLNNTHIGSNRLHIPKTRLRELSSSYDAGIGPKGHNSRTENYSFNNALRRNSDCFPENDYSHHSSERTDTIYNGEEESYYSHFSAENEKDEKETAIKDYTESYSSSGSSPTARRVVEMTTKANISRDLEGRKTINQYVVERKLGKGTYGSVKLCTNIEDGNRVAVKVIKKSLMNQIKKKFRAPGKIQNTQINKIKHEIAILKKLDHPNIVKLLEVIDDPTDDKIFLVFEYIDGGELLGLSDDGVVIVNYYVHDEGTARFYFRQLLNGLEYLHNNRVVHRDIKPSNILITKTGILKLSDFGVSKLVEDDDTLEDSQGTPAFLPPEACSKGKIFGRPADIWASGITLFSMVFGKVPFQGEGYGPSKLLHLYWIIQNEDPEIPDFVSTELKDIILRMLDKNPKTRINMNDLQEHPWVKKDEFSPTKEFSPLSEAFNVAELNGPKSDKIIRSYDYHSRLRKMHSVKKVVVSVNDIRNAISEKGTKPNMLALMSKVKVIMSRKRKEAEISLKQSKNSPSSKDSNDKNDEKENTEKSQLSISPSVEVEEVSPKLTKMLSINRLRSRSLAPRGQYPRTNSMVNYDDSAVIDNNKSNTEL
ncbi:hypothetical protein ABK040_003585 [Willaertia magna]